MTMLTCTAGSDNMALFSYLETNFNKGQCCVLKISILGLDLAAAAFSTRNL